MAEISVGAAQSYIEGEFGGPTEELESEVNATTTATSVVGNDPEALALTLINLGANTAWLLFEDTVSTTRGLLLNANGGYVSLTVRDDQTLPTRRWWAVTSTGVTTILSIRTRRYALTGGLTLGQVQSALASPTNP